MAIPRRTVAAYHRDIHAIPIKKLVCIGKAALKFYLCWKPKKDPKCVLQLVKDLEKCLGTK